MGYKNFLGLGLIFGDLFLVLYIITKIGAKEFALFSFGLMMASMITSSILISYYQYIAKFDKSSTDYWKIINMRRNNKISLKSVIILIAIILVHLLMVIFFPKYYIVLGLSCGVLSTSFLFYFCQEILYKLELMKLSADEMLEVWIKSKKKK